MKTIIIKLVIALSVLTTMACDGMMENFTKHSARWIVKNNTEIDINIVSKRNPNGTFILEAGKRYIKHSIDDFELEDLSFDIPFTDPDDYYEIKTKYRSRTLAIWYYSEKDNEGKQYFNEKSWVYKVSEYGGENSQEISWTFEINPEDIDTGN